MRGQAMSNAHITALSFLAIIVAVYIIAGILLRRVQKARGVSDEKLAESYQKIRDKVSSKKYTGVMWLIQKYVIWNINQSEKMHNQKWL